MALACVRGLEGKMFWSFFVWKYGDNGFDNDEYVQLIEGEIYVPLFSF